MPKGSSTDEALVIQQIVAKPVLTSVDKELNCFLPAVNLLVSGKPVFLSHPPCLVGFV